jgi:hypothetical protein
MPVSRQSALTRPGAVDELRATYSFLGVSERTIERAVAYTKLSPAERSPAAAKKARRNLLKASRVKIGRSRNPA